MSPARISHTSPLEVTVRMADTTTQNILYFGYRTLIGIGTNPAQLMRALIDIDWADMIIPSVNCIRCTHQLKYNSSRSSTYEANGTELDMR